jgi:beta-lactamase regulating signal transducer with metallopeptidase domain
MSGAVVLDQLVTVGGAVWRATWQASVLAALVVAVQLIVGRRLSARWRHAMWMLVLVRLALPVIPSSPLSMFNLAPKQAPVVVAPVTMDIEAAPIPRGVSSAAVPPLAASRIDTRLSAKPQAATPARVAPNLLSNWREILASLWALGAILLALRIAWATWRVARAMRALERVDDPTVHDVLCATAAEIGVRRLPLLLAGEGFFSPALVGVVRPKLLVPRDLLASFQPAELRLIFLHELAHLKRQDVAINWAVTALTVLHWLNPVAWLVAWRLRIERELACDELVLSAASDTDRRAYGHTIVKLLETFSRGATTRSLPAGGVGILEGKQQMKRRITMIAQFARNSRTWTAVAALIVLTLGLVALTDAVQAEPPVKPSTRPTFEQKTIKMADGTVIATNDYEAAEPAALRKPATGPTTAEIAQSDPLMREHLNGLYALEQLREEQAGSLGEKHPKVAQLDAEIAAKKRLMDQLALSFLAQQGRPTKIKNGDLVAVSVMDLVGPGVETVKTARVDGDGHISLPYIGRVNAAGLTPSDLEKAIAKEFREQNLVQNPVVAVSMPERGESLQMVRRPGEAPALAAAPGTPAPQFPVGPEEAGGGGANPFSGVVVLQPAPPEDEATKAMMSRKLPEVKVDSVPLDDVIDFLRDTTGSNIFVNWRALEAAGVDKSSPVTLRVRDVAFRDVLSLILREQGNGVTFTVQNGVIVIDAPAQQARRPKLSTKTYDVRPLVGDLRDDALRAKVQELRQVVMTTVKPQFWEDRQTGISTFEARLIVTASEDVQQEVTDLLKMLAADGGKPTTKPAASASP